MAVVREVVCVQLEVRVGLCCMFLVPRDVWVRMFVHFWRYPDVQVRVVSMPCCELYLKQSAEYRYIATR